MRRIFGGKKKEKPPPLTVDEATERMNKRGDTVEEKIQKLDAELLGYKEQLKKTKPGPAQNAIKARAMRVLKQKKMYEGQRNMLYSQSFNLERVSFATEGIKDAQQTMSAMKAANKDLEGTLKALNIDDVDKLQDEITDIMDSSNEVQDSLGQSNNIPGDFDEEEFLGELDALVSDMRTETKAHTAPASIQPDIGRDLEGDLNLPSAPTGHAITPQAAAESGVPAAPKASIRT